MRPVLCVALFFAVSAPAPPATDLGTLWNELESCLEDEYRANSRLMAEMTIRAKEPAPADAVVKSANASGRAVAARMRFWRALHENGLVEKHGPPWPGCPS